MIVDLRDLTSSPTTRASGNEAFQRLVTLMDADHHSIELDLAAGLLSTSFLDEIVRMLMQIDGLSNVVFRTHRTDDVAKLSRIAELRGARIRYLSDEATESIEVIPRAPALAGWELESEK